MRELSKPVLSSILAAPRWVARGCLLSIAAAWLVLPAAAAAQCPPAEARVTSAYRLVSIEQGTRRSTTAKLRDTIQVEVTGLAGLIAQAKCLEESDGGTHDVVLFLDDRPLPDLGAFPPTDPSLGRLQFELRRKEASREAWTHVLGRPRWEPRKVKVSVGIAGRYAVPSNAELDFEVLPPTWIRIWGLIFLGLVILFFALAIKSDLLRDPLAGAGGDGETRRPYSLSRVQAAIWFFLILASYLLIGMATGDYSTSITGTTLVLLGISAGTTLASTFVDAGKDTPEQQARIVQKIGDLQTEVATLETAIKQPPPAADPGAARQTAAKKVALESRRSQLRKLHQQSEDWLRDILSDANGVSFHRFQIFAWTVVLGIVFAAAVYRDLAMPQFSDTLLGLMGLSSGTYVGLKIPEPTVPSEP